MLPDRINDDSQFQPSPSRRNSYSIPQSASIPENPPQDEPPAQYSRRISSGPSRRQSQSQGALHTQKHVAVSSRAATFQTKPKTEDETPRASQEPLEEDFQELARRDVRRPTGMGSPIAKAEATTKEGAQSPETRQQFSPVPQKDGPSAGGESDQSPSRFLGLSGAQVPRGQQQEQGQEQEPTARTVEQSGARRQTKVVLEEDLAPADAKSAQHDDIPTCRFIDSSGGPFGDDNAWINSTVDLSRSKSIPRSSTRDECDRRLSGANTKEAQIARTKTRRTTSGRAPDTATAFQSAQKNQQPPHEGHRCRSRGRTRDGSRQQSEKTEQRQSSQKYQRSPEHRRDRRRSPQYLDKQVSGEGLPLLEGVQQFPRSFARHSSQINKGRQLKINPAARVQRCNLACRGTTSSTVIYCN
ncbi:hypothetical protein BKA58DRAFT_451565 [Alternaria rosae]|uniref:uncharacterized protein n=1 Tax=Alternaria rosae TaxID=1187941 RepID=UPI001E8CB13C|nr:uncharacterized protein BKA58DRAFT_451565 [Alternaria rosae]KAH6877752.1 hypothetical protein BKA58DRAFT_451565 [Alternaria rosae]